MDAVHAGVGLEHQGLQDPLVLDGLGGQDSLDEILARRTSG